MNSVLIKKTIIFSFIFGAFLGLIALLPNVIGYCLVTLTFFSSFFVILFLKKDKSYQPLNSKEGTILGSVIGFFTTFGFFLSFSPMVCILKMILKQNYYAYAIPDMINMGMWLFFMIVFVVAFIFALTNSITAMGIVWLFDKMENIQINNNEEEK